MMKTSWRAYSRTHHNYLTIAPIDKNKRKQVLSELDVKFVALEKLTSDQELIDYVVEKELYEINPSTLATILGVTTDQLSYSAIQQTERQDVLDYCSDSNKDIGKEEKWSLSMTIS